MGCCCGKREKREDKIIDEECSSCGGSVIIHVDEFTQDYRDCLLSVDDFNKSSYP